MRYRHPQKITPFFSACAQESELIKQLTKVASESTRKKGALNKEFIHALCMELTLRRKEKVTLSPCAAVRVSTN